MVKFVIDLGSVGVKLFLPCSRSSLLADWAMLTSWLIWRDYWLTELATC